MDTGIGIPNDKLPHIFDRYTQIDNGITRKWNGSGIGLSLVKSLVELQGGKISAKSEFEKGSDFIIMLPIKQIEVKNNISTMNNLTTSKVEKCNIEFSDIYN
ncbi:ATP-binding protein [Clostridium celatum]|nr:ATP-binding protein [Clostridium celatum]